MLFVTSDQHFGHTNVIRYCNRPYSSVEEMNEAMIAEWNAVVGPEDTVYHLGDFSMSLGAMRAATPRLNGRKILIVGNHDHCHPVHKKHLKAEQKYIEAGWSEVKLKEQINTPSGPVLLYHLPFAAAKEEPGVTLRYADYRLKYEGVPLLHGHVHSSYLYRSRGYNVGVDQHGMRPIPLDYAAEKLYSLIREEEGHAQSPNITTATS